MDVARRVSQLFVQNETSPVATLSFAEQMKEAQRQAVLKKNCNGTTNCEAQHHLVCCLSKKNE